MSYEVEHTVGKKVTILEIGDVVKIPNPAHYPGCMTHKAVIPVTVKRSRKHQNRSKTY